MGFFKPSELRCHCNLPGCNAEPMKAGVLSKLEGLRADYGKPLYVISATRCPVWNQRVGGAFHSQHLYGNAVDLHFQDTKELETVALLAEKHGFGGIGTGKRLLHIDDRGHSARWTYSDK